MTYLIEGTARRLREIEKGKEPFASRPLTKEEEKLIMTQYDNNIDNSCCSKHFMLFETLY